MIKKLSFLLVLVVVFFPGCNKETLGPVTDIGVYLNEVQATGGDWLEIYNSTSSPVSLSGFKVYDDLTDKYSIPSGSIPANGYFILNCDGTGVGGNASFKLSSAGETIYLEDSKGNLIDDVSFPELDNGSSYARFPDGTENWKKTGTPTKGAANGSDQAASISQVNHLPIVPGLNMAVTVSATVTDVSGVSLVKLHYRKDAGSESIVPMTISAGVYSGTIPAMATTGNVQYYIEAINTRNVTTFHPAAAPTKTHSYLLNTDPLPPSLVINEFLAFNTTCCPDNSSGTSEFNDWIEIYNGGSNAVDLNGYYLSDDNTNPFKFKIEGSSIVPAKGYLIVWADEQGSQGLLHASFQLASAGEEVGLYYIDGRTIDHHTFSSQTENQSEGRKPDGGAWTVKLTPTPATTNN